MRLLHKILDKLRFTNEDIIATICVLIFMSFIHYVSFNSFEKCKTYDPKLAEHDIQYRNYYNSFYKLNCDRAEKREILHTRPLSIHGLFSNLIFSVKLVIAEKDKKYQDYTDMIVPALIAIITIGGNAGFVALDLNCITLAIFIFFGTFVHLCLWTMRWKLTWVIWFLGYGVIVSKLYGETFDIMAVVSAYLFAPILLVMGGIFLIICWILEMLGNS